MDLVFVLYSPVGFPWYGCMKIGCRAGIIHQWVERELGQPKSPTGPEDRATTDILDNEL